MMNQRKVMPYNFFLDYNFVLITAFEKYSVGVTPPCGNWSWCVRLL